MRRKTIKTSVTLSGIALHSGAQAEITFKPSASAGGIFFVRTDIAGRPRIPATVSAVSDLTRGTSLAFGGAEVAVVEHVLASLYALSISDIEIELSAKEPPALDGSSVLYFNALKGAGITDLSRENLPLTLLRELVVNEGSGVAVASPSDRFLISFMIDFPGSAIGRQELSVEITERSFEGEIAQARTFGFLEEVESLKKAGLALGASEENALVASNDGYINKPRFRDEAVRHKILDLIGDLCLLGRPLKAHIAVERGSHKLNAALARAILEEAGST